MTHAAISSPTRDIPSLKATAPAPGSPDPLAGQGPVAFGFRYLDKPFHATVTRGNGHARLAVHGHLGVVPFTAESAPVRAAILKLLRTKDARSASHFELAENHDVLMHGDCELGLPLCTAGIVAGAAEILIAARERIDAIVAQLQDVPERPCGPQRADADSISPEA
jgi:hypothetical protein